MTEEKTLNTGSLQEWTRKPSNAGACRGKAHGGEGPQGGHLGKIWRTVAWSVSFLPSAQNEVICTYHWRMVPEQVPEDGTPGCTATLEIHWTVMLGLCSRLVILQMCTINLVGTATKCNSCPVPGE